QALLSKAGRPVEELDHRLAEQAANPRRFVLMDLVEDAALHVPDLDLRVLIGEIAAAEQRMHFLQALLPLGLKVWGDSGWSELGAAYQGPAGHQQALTRIYNAAQVHVDIGRIYQKDIVTMRVFDVLACGGFLVTQDSPELRALFTPGEHLLAVNTPQEMHDAVLWALAHPEQARRIAKAGQERVLAHHTLSQRLDEMLAPTTWETLCTPFSSAAPDALAQL
ncbi:MAG: spore maturation protein CgeB, partial [Cognaticolwellia sp.]